MTVRILAKRLAFNKAMVRGVSALVMGMALLVVPCVWAADLLLMPAPKLPNAMAVRAVYLDLAAAGDRLVAVGEYGLILFSDDGGTTWQQAQVPTSVTFTAVDFPTDQKGWAVGHDGVVLHSTDRGETWQIQLSGLDVNVKAKAQIEKKVAELSAVLDAAPEEGRSEHANRLEDMELLLSDMSVPIEANAPTSLLDVLFMDESTGYAVGAFGMIIETRDGGRNWTPIVARMNNIDGYHYYGIDKMSVDGSDVLFLAGEVGLVMRSMDGAVTWEMLSSPYEGSFFGITASSNEVLAYGLGGHAFISKDLGQSWQAVEKSDTNTQAISSATVLLDGSFMMSANNGILYHLKKADAVASRLAVAVPGSMALADAGGGAMVVAGVVGLKRISMADTKESN